MRSVLMFLLPLLLCVGLSSGQSQQPSSKTEKKEKFSWGFDERVRFVGTDNFIDADDALDDAWRFSRFRTRFWSSVPLSEKLKFNLRLTNEFRKYWDPEGSRYDFRLNEFVFDNLFLEATPRSDLTLRIGRQDLMLGEGLVVMDGSPLDGSRTFYFNAVRATWKTGKGTVDTFAISNTATERYIPAINRNYSQGILERDEQGAGIYVTQQLTKSLKGEFYNIIKREEQFGNLPLSRLNTTGARFTGSVNGWFEHAGELAVQFGDYGPHRRSGVGGYVDIRKAVPSVPKLTLQLNYTYLSGDDPATENFEGWNPIFSRWPKWSELYLYTLMQEGRGPGYFTNVSMVCPGFNVKLSDKQNVDVVYRQMRSVQNRVIANQSYGKNRGHLAITKYNYRVNKHLSGHLLAELLQTGDFYPSGSSFAYFLRSEFLFSF
jgi:hypothetical protein